MLVTGGSGVALGLPAGLANGTNRVGVVMQVVTSAVTFHRQGFRDYRLFARLDLA